MTSLPPRGGLGGLVGFRPGLSTDHALIYSSWLRSYRGAAPVREVLAPVYMRGQAALVAKLLANASVRIAHPTGDPPVVLGYVVASGETLHFVYVKGELRGQGLGRLLVPTGAYAEYSHMPVGEPGKRLVRGMIYNPYAGG